MLKKDNRLSSNFEFNITRKYGQKLSGSLMHLYYLMPRNYNDETKMGVVVSSRFHKNAVTRNRVKRLITEAFRLNSAKIPDSLWIVIHPRQKILDSKYEEISAELNQILQKISIA